MLQYVPFPRMGEFTRTTTKQGLAMIAKTTNNGKFVRLGAARAMGYVVRKAVA